MYELTLEQGRGVSTMLIVAALAILLTGICYYRAFGMLRRRQWILLLALRIATILIIILLLFRPVLSYHKDLKEQPSLIFLLDRSSSMSISDGSSGVTRFNQARDQVELWCGQLEDDFNLHLVEFAEQGTPLEEISQIAGLNPDGKATSLSAALTTAAGMLPDYAELEAAIMVSDGVHNSIDDPREVAAKSGMTVHTVGVGASLRSDVSYRDIQVTGIDCPDRLLLNNKAKITGSVEGVGLSGRVVSVILEDDGEPIDEIELTLDGLEGSQAVEFEFRPTARGRHIYAVRVPPVAEEKIEENNQRSTIALVVEPGIRVLYVEGTLRPEYGALVDRFLAKDPDLEFCALIQTRPNRFLKRTNMEALDLDTLPSDAKTIEQFDVFIFGDLDSSYFKPEQQKLFVDRVRDGAGLVMLGGYHSLGPGGYGGTPLGEVLPALVGSRDVGQVTDSFLPQLTPEGVRHPIFANIADFFPTTTGSAKQGGLPSLDGCTRVAGVRAGATVLATCPVDAANLPVLATQPLDAGRTAVFCGDTTRKWQQGPRALGQDSPFLRFWGQMVRWLAGRETAVEAGAGVLATTDKGYYEPQEVIKISAIVRDAEGRGAENAAVTAKIQRPDGSADRQDLSAVSGPGGHYSATYQPESGPYEIIVEARISELTIQSDKLVVEVGRPNLEFEKLDLDEKMLGRIANETGGRYFHITTADHLIDQLDRTQRAKRIYMERRLFWPPLLWLLFVVILTVEWILRRRFQLR